MMNQQFQDRDGVLHTIRLRNVIEEDKPFLYDVVSSTVREIYRLNGGDVCQLEPMLQFQFENQNREYQQRYPEATHHILCYDGLDVGRIYVDRTPQEIHILDLTILPYYRGMGIGTCLFHALEEEARREAKTIRIYVEDGNPSMRLFLRLGYKWKKRLGDVHNLMEWNSQESQSQA